jgi:hypothetical protein
VVELVYRQPVRRCHRAQRRNDIVLIKHTPPLVFHAARLGAPTVYEIFSSLQRQRLNPQHQGLAQLPKVWVQRRRDAAIYHTRGVHGPLSLVNDVPPHVPVNLR